MISYSAIFKAHVKEKQVRTIFQLYQHVTIEELYSGCPEITFQNFKGWFLGENEDEVSI